MKRPDYRTLQALDAVIRERGFERAAQKLCITQSAVSQRIKQLENMFGQPLLVRTVPPRPTEQGQKLLALLRDRKSTRLNSSHIQKSRMPSSA